MKIRVKEWIGVQKVEDMYKYHLALECVDRREDGYFINDGKVTFIAREIIKESDKAICFNLECETLEQNAHKPVMVWIPKSQIIEMV